MQHYFECFMESGKMVKQRYQCPSGYMWSEESFGTGKCVEATDEYLGYPFAHCDIPDDLCPETDPCLQNPCYSGVACTFTSVAPFYTCGACPAGFTGDGETCDALQCPVGFAGIGDCAPDSDLDGFPDTELGCSSKYCRSLNAADNCPLMANSNQADADGDGLGDVCDNCPLNPNPGQEDVDEDLLGDACDDNVDLDGDGVEDSADNCPSVANSNQQDVDGDGDGDLCDLDSDNDGVNDPSDNCFLLPNPGQEDANGDGRGDACSTDFDGDRITDANDNCIKNPNVYATDFRQLQMIALEPQSASDPPVWVVYDNGAEIHQIVNSDPGLAIATKAMPSFMLWHGRRDHRTGLTRLRGHYLEAGGLCYRPWPSTSGCSVANWYHTNQATLLWHDGSIGWSPNVAYRWQLHHRPDIGTIRFYLYRGNNEVMDSGNIYDDSLKGGRLGLYCFSQEEIIWSNVKYTCEEFFHRRQATIVHNTEGEVATGVPCRARTEVLDLKRGSGRVRKSSSSVPHPVYLTRHNIFPLSPSLPLSLPPSLPSLPLSLL
ncbi:thrombospondin [Penaeus vannamei]|uniref:Thrombospondin n=1 Tax=Penaeus vannamei TaxID=6689 RepID=A0A3R7MDZ9_PENVA|nr:thrombospondin [Penaeus vannamei]